MTAFFVATVTVHNAERFSEYAAKAGETFAPFGGSLVLRGKNEGTLSGNANHQAVGIVQFPDLDALHAWYASPDYQALIPLRDVAADMNITTYSMPT